MHLYTQNLQCLDFKISNMCRKRMLLLNINYLLRVICISLIDGLIRSIFFMNGAFLRLLFCNTCVFFIDVFFWNTHLEFLWFDFIPQMHHKVGHIQIGFIYFHLGKGMKKKRRWQFAIVQSICRVLPVWQIIVIFPQGDVGQHYCCLWEMLFFLVR